MIKIGKIRITKKFLLKLKNFCYSLFLVAVLLLAGLIFVSTLNIPSNYKIFVVQSGSMEPAIRRMGIVVVKPADEYRKGDVITVSEPANPGVTLTHRIVEVGETDGQISYITKGDANEEADTEKRPKENVLGKVILTVPFVGYPIDFAKTKTGLIVLVVIPAVIIIYNELMVIKKEAKRLLLERKRRKLNALEKVEVAVGKEMLEVEQAIEKISEKNEKKK